MKNQVSLFLLLLTGAFQLAAQWQNMGPNTGKVTCVYKGANALYAGLEKVPFGLYISKDHGESWQSMNGPIAAVTSIIEVDNWLFANGSTSDRVFYSRDNGKTWNFGTCTGTTAINSICNIGYELFAATNTGVFSSQDTGKTWVKKYNNGSNTSITSCMGYLISCSNAGLEISKNRGKDWTIANGEQVIKVSSKGRLAFGNHLSSPYGVMVSADSGNTWNNYTAGLPSTTIPSAFTYIKDTLFMLAQNKVYFSTDTGKNWSLSGTLDYTSTGSGLVADGSILINSISQADLTGGIYKSSNKGASWKHVGLGIYTALRLGKFNDTLFMAENGAFTISADRGKTWTSIGYTLTTVEEARFYGNDIYITGQPRLMVSHDRGKTFQVELNSQCHDFARLGSRDFLTTVSDLYYKDASSSWKSAPALTGKYLGKILVSGSNVIVSGRSGFDDSYYSTDTGKTWKILNDSFFKAVSCTLTDGSTLYAGVSTFQGVYSVIKSTDNGLHWVKCKNGLPNIQTNAMAVKDGVIYLVSNKGLFRSSDQGGNWTAITGIFPQDPFALNNITTDDSFLYVAAASGGVWRGIPGKGSGISNFTKTGKQQLHIYPNPASNALYATFELPDAQTVSFELLNISGQIQKQLSMDISETGVQQICIPIEGLSPGIYFLRLQTKEGIMIQKVICGE